jgi:DNA-binding GntR family transcriptional regulator
MNKLSENRIRPIRDEVYHILRREIMSGAYKPGERLQEEQLAEILGVSRTPVREAMRKLETEKLVDYYPHRGTIVSDVGTSEIEELFLVRTFIEVLINKKVARNATQKDKDRLREILNETVEREKTEEIILGIELFNKTLFDISKSEYLVDLNCRVREIIKRIVMANALDPERRQSIFEEHSKIVDAIETKNEELIEKYTIEHIQSSFYKFKNKTMKTEGIFNKNLR